RSNSTMAFEVNQGQTNPEAKYLARGPGYTLFLTSTGAVWSLRPQLSASETGRTTAMLRMQISGADSYPRIAAAETLPGIGNYYIGVDPSKWQTQVAQYARVSYEKLYPGVNLSWHGEQRQLEFDFAIAPESDPSTINLRFSGAEKLTIDSSGDLVLSTVAGDVHIHGPAAYQEKNGIRAPVASHFVVKKANEVAFALSGYDRSRELTLAPRFSYSRASMMSASLPSKS